eukprot:1039580-Prymnesium_polylepis.1
MAAAEERARAFAPLLAEVSGLQDAAASAEAERMAMEEAAAEQAAAEREALARQAEEQAAAQRVMERAAALAEAEVAYAVPPDELTAGTLRIHISHAAG